MHTPGHVVSGALSWDPYAYRYGHQYLAVSCHSCHEYSTSLDHAHRSDVMWMASWVGHEYSTWLCLTHHEVCGHSTLLYHAHHAMSTVPRCALRIIRCVATVPRWTPCTSGHASSTPLYTMHHESMEHSTSLPAVHKVWWSVHRIGNGTRARTPYPYAPWLQGVAPMSTHHESI